MRSGDPERPRTRAPCLAVALAVGMAGLSGPVQAELCSQPLAADRLDAFLNDPKSVLRVHPRGGLALTNEVRTLAAGGVGSLKAIGLVMIQATAQQKDAIGLGLARAEGACSARSPEVARRIREMVRTSGDRDVMRSYARFFTEADGGSPAGTSTSAGMSVDRTTKKTIDTRTKPPIGPAILGDPFAKP